MTNFKPNENFIFYLYWICERQKIFWDRLEGKPFPWTEDEILRDNKFTNTYRALDRSSQFLIKNVIYNKKGLDNDYDTEDIFWRIMLYKHFNLPETWNALEKEFGDITLETGIDNISQFLNEYCLENKEFTPYSNAYMMTAAFLSGNSGRYCHLRGNGWKKYEYYFYIYKKELFEDKLIYKILKSGSFKELCDNLLKITGVAGFLAYQYAQDLNYSTLFNFDENEVCLAGPGTRRGIDRTFDVTGTTDYEQIVKWVQANFNQLLEDYNKKEGLSLEFRSLPNREMKVPDFSNCFCETFKYLKTLNPSDEVGSKRMKNSYSGSKVGSKIDFMFPPKWNVGNLK